MAPNKINKYTKRYSICVFYRTKKTKTKTKTKNGPNQTNFSLQKKKKGKHLYDISLERHHSGFLSTDRNSKHHSVRIPHKPFQFTLRSQCLPRASDSVQNQPELQRTLAEPVSSALKSNTQCWETGSTANGHKNMPRRLIPETKRSQW